MGDEKPPSAGPFEDTESIDVASLLKEDVTSSGSFDVSHFGSTSLGKLMQAFPIPALLIDQTHRIAFANQVAGKINPEYKKLLNRPISSIAGDAESAERLKLGLDEVFATRMPQTCEAILGSGKNIMWARVAFRSIRLEDRRLALIIAEDLTLEKRQLILGRQYRSELEEKIAGLKKAETELEKTNLELEQRIRQRTAELLELNEQLEREAGERIRAEKLLHKSQQRLELALKGADLGLWDYDVEKNEVFVDQTWADIFGYSLADIKPDIGLWRSLLHPDDRPAVVKAWNNHLEGAAPYYEAEHRVRAKSGKWNWVLTRGKVVKRDKNGKALRVSGTVFNISDRKLAEEKLFRLSQVFMESIDPIFIRDLDGLIVDLNKAVEETYGWKREELLGKSIKMLAVPNRLHIWEDLQERCKRGEKVQSVEGLHRKKSGEVLPVLISLFLLTNQRGASVGIASIVKNLTDLKRTEAMLRSKTEALERSNKDLEEFAYVAAHDLREPLVGISVYLKLLERSGRDSLDAESKEFISRAQDITLRMDALVQSLLSYSRLGSGAKSLEPTDCNVAFDQALSNLRSTVERSGARITCDPLPTVVADPLQVIQLFQNLVSNAIKFAGAKPLDINVGVARGASCWKFHVRDNGIGIESSHFERIFRIFQRLEPDPKRPGTGIGLANCKKIVEHHGGKIWVESEPGEGSTFFFTIPDRVEPTPELL
jgi:PAS domain S-box-containing protein